MVDNEVNKRVVIEITTDDKASAQLEKISKLIDSIKGGTVNIGVSGAGSAGTSSQPNRQQEITKTAVDRALKTLSQSKEKTATDRIAAQTQKLIDKAEKDRIGEVKRHIPLYKQFRSAITGVLIDLHLIRIAGQHSKVVATMFQTLADSIGALIDVALYPLLDIFVPFIKNLLSVVSYVASLSGAFRGLVAAVLGFLVALTVTTGMINAAMGVFRWTIGKPAQRATGGPLGAGQAAIVGERGPELIVPSHAVDVVPNSKLRFLAEGTIGSSISSMFLGGVGGAAIGGLLTGGWGGAIGGGLLGGGLGALFDMPNLLAESVAGIMSNTGVQSVLTSLNVVAGSINAILAPLAPVMGVAGLALGAAFGAKRALGGGSEKMTAAQIKQDASIGYGTQNMIQSAAKGTNKLLTLILLRLSQCFRICPDSIAQFPKPIIPTPISPGIPIPTGGGQTNQALNPIANRGGQTNQALNPIANLIGIGSKIGELLKSKIGIPQAKAQGMSNMQIVAQRNPLPASISGLPENQPAGFNSMDILSFVGMIAGGTALSAGIQKLGQYVYEKAFGGGKAPLGGVGVPAKEPIPVKVVTPPGGADVTKSLFQRVGPEMGYAEQKMAGLAGPVENLPGFAERYAAAEIKSGSGIRAAGIGALIGGIVLQGIEDYKNVMHYQKFEPLEGAEPWGLIEMMNDWRIITNESEFAKEMERFKEFNARSYGYSSAAQAQTTFNNTFHIQGTDQTIIDKIVKELQLQSNRTRGMGI